MSLQKMKAILRHKGYEIYSRPFELNIVGLRSRSTLANRFDDEIHVFYKVSNFNWNYHVFKATTDPGTFWLKQPMQPQGTAILAEGQYKHSHQLGLHQGKYLALVQKASVDILRDYNRDAVLDFNNGIKLRGIFGINIHRANKTGSTKSVDRNSAGCQVFENADDFNFFLKLCQQHKQRYGNSFTYSLIDFRAVRRQNFRYAISGIGALGLLGLGYALTVHGEKIKTVFEEVSDFFKNTKTQQENDEQKFKGDTAPNPSG